jgi:hypothetical protein
MTGKYNENGSDNNAENDDGRLFIGRRRGTPRLRWMDDVVAGLKIMKIRHWTQKMRDRQQWRLVVEETKAHPGLFRREDGSTSHH